MHHVVHPRVPDAFPVRPQQVEVLQGGTQRHRPPGHPTLLHIPVPGRDREQQRILPGREADCADLPNHADPSNPEAGQTFHRAAEPRVYPEEQLQGTRTADAVPGHRGHDLLEPGVLRREGRTGHHVQEHSRDVLVGEYHHDDGRVRGHVSHDPVGENCGDCVLCVWCSSHRSAHSHHREQLRRVLQEPDAARQGAQETGGHGKGEEGRQHRHLQPARQPERCLREQHGPYQCVSGHAA